MSTDLPEILTAAEAAELLRLPSVAAVYQRFERGKLPGGFKDGRHLRVRRDELRRALGLLPLGSAA